MQTITYTNLRGESVTFGGDPPYILERIKGLGMVGLDISQSSGVYQQGATIHRVTRGKRPLDISFHVDGRPSMKSMYEYRQALLGILSPRFAYDEEQESYARITYENDYGSWWTWAVPESARFEKRMAQLQVSCPLSFLCPSPFWYALSEDTLVLGMKEESFTLPFTLPFSLGSRSFRETVTNTGHVDTPVLIEIFGTGEQPALVNHDTGAKISITRPIAHGEVLRIQTDPDNLRVELVSERGFVSNAHGYLGLDSALSEFVLRPGLNDIEYLPSLPTLHTKVRLRWYPVLEGV